MNRAGRYKKHSKSKAERADKKLAELLQHGSYEPPVRDPAKHKRWFTPLDDLNTIQLRFEIWKSKGRMVEFAIMLQIRHFDDWHDAATADICHGHAHIHVTFGLDSSDTRVRHVVRLDSIDDVEPAFRETKRALETISIKIRDNKAREDDNP